MRKFSKILALVLAFAMVLCPVLTAAAETKSDVLYSSAVLNAEIADGKANAVLVVKTMEEINAIDFKINFAKGTSFDPETDTVTISADESGDAAAWNVVTSYADGVLSVVAIDGDDMANVATYLVFNITLTVENASDYEFYLTKIYAVGAGSADADEVISVFPCADNAQSGVIDVEAARTDCPDYFVTNVCAHANVTTEETPATCTEAGKSVVTCTDCGAVISETAIPATGHNYVVKGEIIAATEEAVGYYGYYIACDVCDAKNPAYYAEDGSVRTDVDFAALAAEGLIEEIPMLKKPCDTATEWSSDETGHWYDCTCGEKHDFAEHIAGEAVEENRVEASAGVAGSYDTVVYCSVCNYEISRVTNEIPALPVGPAEDAKLVFQGASVGFADASLQINFRIRNTVLALYDDVKVVIIPQKYDLTTFNRIENPAEIVVEQSQLSAAGSTMKSYLYTDIYLYELGLDVNYMLRGYNNGELVAVSPVYTTSAASYLKSVFASSSDPKFRTLVTDTLIVGASSATNMAASYADSDLANDPSILEGFDTSEATATIDSYNTTNVFNSYNTNFKNTSSTHQFRTSVQIGKAPSITYSIKDSKAALDLSKLSFHVTYSRVNAAGTTVNFDKTFSAADGSVSLISGWVNFKFDQVGLQGGSTDISTVVIYDGETVCDSVYSVETYLGGQLSGSLGELAAALIKLGISYRAYAAK